jgi:HD-GYP domain-containing protein (c-di-GMP phosphodiesterase class II)
MSEKSTIPQPVSTPALDLPAGGPSGHVVTARVSSPLPVLGAALLSEDLFDVEGIGADAKLLTSLRQLRGGDLSGLRFRLIRVPLVSLENLAVTKPEDYLTGGNEVAFTEVIKLTDAYRLGQAVPPLVARYVSADQSGGFELLDGNKRLSAITAAHGSSADVYELLDGVAAPDGDVGPAPIAKAGAFEEIEPVVVKAPRKPMPRRAIAYLGIASGVALALVVHAVLLTPLGPGIALPIPFLPTVLTPLAGVIFWTVICLVATANPIAMPKGATMTSANPVVVAAAVLGGPLAAVIVAGIGTLEVREVKHRIPVAITLDNHLGFVIPAYITATFFGSFATLAAGNTFLTFLLVLASALLFFMLNLLMVAVSIALDAPGRTLRTLRRVILVDAVEIYPAHFILAPIAWLMAFVYSAAGAWAVLITVVPLFTTRLAHKRLLDMKDTFLATIKALAHAMEARDYFTNGHSHRVSETAVEIGRALELPDSDIELLEWSGILHDIGKIGVQDAVLMKPGRLTEEERAVIQAHPVIGTMIIRPIKMLSREAILIRHHHEWFDGTGYPDKLAGEAIPFLSRVLAVADSFDAMTSQRPYRMKPLTPAQAVVELRKGCGTQFDPVVVAAFEKTSCATAEDPRRFVGEEMNTAGMASAAARIARGVTSIIND